MKSLVRIMCIMLILVVTITLVGCKGKGYAYEKITQLEEIPEKVRCELSKIELERGAYFFSSAFTDESAYLVVCGGEMYQEGYDANIEKLDYNSLTFDMTSPSHPIYGFFVVEIEEKSTDSRQDYGSNSVYPYVVFRIDGHGAEEDWLIIPHNQSLSVNYWWGLDPKRLESKLSICEVLNAPEQVPACVWDTVKRAAMKNQPYGRMWKVHQDNSIFLILADRENEPFDIVIESTRWFRPMNGPATVCDIVVRKHSVERAQFYRDDIPFCIFKIQSKKYKDLVLRRLLVFEDNLKWSFEDR